MRTTVGQLTINGKKALTFRIKKLMPENKTAAYPDTKAKEKKMHKMSYVIGRALTKVSEEVATVEKPKPVPKPSVPRVDPAEMPGLKNDRAAVDFLRWLNKKPDSVRDKGLGK